MTKYLKNSSTSSWVVVFFDDNGNIPVGRDGIFYSPYNSRGRTVDLILSQRFRRRSYFTNFIVISYSTFFALTFDNIERLQKYIDTIIKSGNYYSQDF